MPPEPASGLSLSLSLSLGLGLTLILTRTLKVPGIGDERARDVLAYEFMADFRVVH